MKFYRLDYKDDQDHPFVVEYSTLGWQDAIKITVEERGITISSGSEICPLLCRNDVDDINAVLHQANEQQRELILYHTALDFTLDPACVVEYHDYSPETGDLIIEKK